MVDTARSFGLSLCVEKFENSLKSKERSILREPESVVVWDEVWTDRRNNSKYRLPEGWESTVYLLSQSQFQKLESLTSDWL